MSFNQFGTLLTLSTFGESHGPCIGGVLDGLPANIHIELQAIQDALKARSPGDKGMSPRQENDPITILSGLMHNTTTGAPLAFTIPNQDAKPSTYRNTQDIIRPGHANATYHHKYKTAHQQGGGRASARETAIRVAAGAICQHILNRFGTHVYAYLDSMGPITQKMPWNHITPELIKKSNFFCPDNDTFLNMQNHLATLQHTGDSCGGIVKFVIQSPPSGLGEPIYQKIEAQLAQGMMSIPASKGFEIGRGFESTKMLGSEHNDQILNTQGQSKYNHAGGILGGISNGDPIWGAVAFKPPSSIRLEQKTLDFNGQSTVLNFAPPHRHDPCVAIRAVPVVKAMCQLVLCDLILCHQSRNMNEPYTQPQST
ncbi:chorismate synthase [Gammaproteobacteria bacterium]|nr:chorismate synthase [Gammaproteobacteria bacterium]